MVNIKLLKQNKKILKLAKLEKILMSWILVSFQEGFWERKCTMHLSTINNFEFWSIAFKGM